jgi:hypothetical protein
MLCEDQQIGITDSLTTGSDWTIIAHAHNFEQEKAVYLKSVGLHTTMYLLGH